ncbi:uncharacterized protein PAC_12880 [Phialocephala subalpina]|uniref:Heterokaryon incompatibility domain-containing protein n=1 Tax=Phialocephala subalpina TaxID=576137 RepID=A0A1L7XD86_9HELO|nr:uncharacterized protein PAC_12880 [Phialocephala subalpina]
MNEEEFSSSTLDRHSIDMATSQDSNGQRGSVGRVQSTDLCARCAAIDFDVICSSKVVRIKESRVGMFVMSLDATAQELKNSTCSLCKFFGSFAPPQLETPRHLRTFSGRRAFLDHSAHGNTTTLGVLVIPAATVNSLHQSLEQTGYLCFENLGQRPAAPQPDSCIIYPNAFNTEFARNCLVYCEKHHREVCNPSSIRNLPSLKLIDCRARKTITSPTTPRYMALSSVWASSTCGTITKENFEAEDMPLPKFPRVVEDSMIVAAMMGMHYLWVDRYCIDQTDTDKHD